MTFLLLMWTLHCRGHTSVGPPEMLQAWLCAAEPGAPRWGRTAPGRGTAVGAPGSLARARSWPCCCAPCVLSKGEPRPESARDRGCTRLPLELLLGREGSSSGRPGLCLWLGQHSRDSGVHALLVPCYSWCAWFLSSQVWGWSVTLS